MSGPLETRGSRALGRVTDVFGVAGSRGRTVASWLDLARSTGPAYTWRAARDQTSGVLDRSLRDALYRRIWAEAAEAVGAELVDLGAGFMELRREDATARVWQQVVGIDDPVTLQLALDKGLVHGLLGRAGVPVPAHLAFDFSDYRPALRFMAESGGQCVVKPASGTGGGDGTTAGVDTPERFMRARLHAGRFSGRLLIERQVPGPVHRLLFLDGELIDVIRHLPPRLTGDGRHTVEELIGIENERRLRARGEAGLSLLGVGLDTVFTLERAGLRLSSVLPAGRTVAVQTVTNDNGVDDSATLREPPAPEVLDAARAAVEAVGLRLAGVDVIAPSIDEPLERSGGAVAEVNGTPGIHHHYLTSDREGAMPVAIPILERVLEWAETHRTGYIQRRRAAT